ncbi:TPA: DNA cytosine methyltransferase, partial [Citrobacter koseri]|nr:DNA cytosine methyltransferase [Citrobacter koseri]
VADPRPSVAWHKNVFRVVSMNQHAGTVTTGHGPSSGGQAVADPRYSNWHPGASSRKLNVVPWEGTAGTVTGSQQVASGALSIADPRVLDRTKGDAYLTGGHYGVVGFDQSAGAVSASARHDNGRWSVADPRMPAANDRLTCIIQSLDGTWHRPFTTLELAALQSLVDPEEQLILDGLSDSDWRERIGNAVPPAAAEAIAGVMGTTLLLAEAGETFMLSNTPIWVRPVAVALSVAQQEVNP